MKRKILSIAAASYPVRVAPAENGTVTVSHQSARKSNVVTVTVTPDEGYELDGLSVVDSEENRLDLTGKGGGKYTFTMPGHAVTVTAVFSPVTEGCDGGADCPSRNFTDVGGPGTWYHEAVDYVLRTGLMSGYANGTFGPENQLTRARFAQILYNREGKSSAAGGSGFTDAAPGQWYTAAVTWAAENGIVTGYAGGRFGPNDKITCEQLAVMLWRYMGSPAANGEMTFTDGPQIGGYALEAVRWAVENGVVSGCSDGRLNPGGLTTRAQAAQMLMNLLDK